MDTYTTENAQLSKKCGDTIFWRIEQKEKKYVLILDGYVDMYDYDARNLPPWHDLAFCELELSPEITYIGKYAFAGSS